MKKIGSLFLLLCVFNLLALAGLVGFLVATGRLDGTKATAITDLLRHQGTPTKFREQLYEILQPTPPTTAPATQPTLAADGSTDNAALAVTADERIDFVQKSTEQERLRLENQAQELRHRQELLLQLQADVQIKLDKIDAEKKSIEEAKAHTDDKAADESFQKSLALYDELKTKQVKDLFAPMQPEVVAKFLQAMDPSRAGKIISEFKSPSEAAFIATVLERIRTNGTTSAIGSVAAGTTPRAPGT